MLARLTPDQVSNFWDVIKVAVEQSHPPFVGEKEDRDNNILQALLEDRMDCWMDYTTNGEGSVLNVILLTTVTVDDCSGERCLLIYSIYGYRRSDGLSWVNGIETLKKWARYHGCQKIIAYTNSARVLAITEKLGFTKDYSLIALNCV